MITAIVLAAGLSRRMGRFKLTLPWGEATVIGQVLATLEAAGVSEVVTVTGHRADEVRAVLFSNINRIVFNPHYAAGEMLSSIQVGLGTLSKGEALPGDSVPPDGISTDAAGRGETNFGRSASPLPCAAALLCLGDQPQMEVATVQAVLAAGAEDDWTRIVIPSYRMRAGHPILLPAWLWPEILACTGTLRDVMAAHRDRTRYLVVDTPSVLADLDTPEDYESKESTPCA